MDTTELERFVARGLEQLADPEKAGAMAAYMKGVQPFFGVQKPARVPLFREMVRRFPPATRADYEQAVLALWGGERREQRYAALHYARRFEAFVTPEALPLYERLIREGAWWDLVDEIAAQLVAPLQLDHRAEIRPVMDAWIDDEASLWIRRTAILSQLKHREQTDAAQLFDYCLRRAGEKAFFIRKAIGWALREYAYHAPQAVRAFLDRNRERLSGLSYREAAKHLDRLLPPEP